MRFIYTKTFLVFSGVLLVVVIALFLQVKGWLGPIEYLFLQAPKPAVAVVDSITRPIRSVFTTLFSMKGILTENHQLATEVGKLKQQQVVLDQLKVENELLKNELEFRSKADYALQSCTILSRDPQNISDALVLDCGESTGIKVGQAVISNGYLVAKVVFVGKLTSTAVLITNSQSSVDAKLSKNNVEGVIKGSFGSGLVFDLVSQSADVSVNDLVVTAGIDPNIPKNILIGQIGQQISGGNDLFKKLTLVSPVKAHALDYVFVVKP